MNNISVHTENTVTPESSAIIGDSLAGFVREQFLEAQDARRNVSANRASIEQRMLQALRARCSKYDPGDEGLLGGIDIYIAITDKKCSAATAWMTDILLNSIDKPWLLKPTPIPELPEWMKNQVVNALQMELQDLGAPIQDIRHRAKQLKDAALKYAQKIAQEACDKMEIRIEDQLLEGGWRDVFGQFLDDLSTFPAAFIRSPIIQKQKRNVWDGNKLVVKEQIIYATRRISPFDAYPSPDSSDTQNGRYFIERLQLQVADLYSMLGLEGFNNEAIREAIDMYASSGFQEFLTPDYERKVLEGKNITPTQRKTIDTLIYNGKIQGQLLLDNHVLVPDAQEFYEVEIWTINDQTIKAVLNPYPLGERPIFSSCFRKIPGSLWGKGIPDLLHDLQRVTNSSMRSIVRNMSYSSGPIGEVDVSRLGDGEKPDQIIPYRLYHVDSDPSFAGKPAFNFTTVQSNAPQFQQIMEYCSKLADDMSGVPAYVLGSPQVSGAGRTYGGLNLMMGNAAKGIKNVIKNVDVDAIEKLVTFYYNLNMLAEGNDEIKADAQVIARGATGLLQKEMAQSKITELMQTYLPLMQLNVISLEGMKVLARESLKGTGLPVDDIIPDPARAQQLQQGLAHLGAPNAFPMPNNSPSFPGAPPPLDGRSAAPPFPQQAIPPQLGQMGGMNPSMPGGFGQGMQQ